MEPISLLIKPASGKCNMRCKYCFYADEAAKRETADCGIMSIETLEKVLQNALFYAKDHCTIAFQGGEPTLAGIAFYRKAIEYTQKYNVNACKIEYAIQTNGYLIDEVWAAFLAEHRFLVGISLDGDEEIHNAYRVDVKGQGTFHKVFYAIELLKKYQVDFNILTVITKASAAQAKKIYNFYSRNHLMYQQYIECLDPLEDELSESDTVGAAEEPADSVPGQMSYSLKADELAGFLKQLFDKWYRDIMHGKLVYIRYFENIMMILAGKVPESCSMLGKCGKQWVVEADGSVYPCDFYALDQWKLGNLTSDSMKAIEEKRRQLRFIEMSEGVPAACGECKWFPVCRNGCRRNCSFSQDNKRQVNRFCKAYKEFLEYSYPRFMEIIRVYQLGE